MPKAGDEKYYERIADGLRQPFPAAAQWDIEVVLEPCGKRNVPPPPEFPYVAREVRGREIPLELYAEELRYAYRYVGIAGEIAIYLEGEAK